MEREIREFYEKVSRDEDFKKSILLAKEKYSEEKDTLIQLKKIINDVIIPFSKKYGYDFDIEDLLNFERSTNEKKSKLINEASLENVSGGFSPRINAICLTALLGISSFSGFASNNVANAADHAEASDLIIFSSPEEDEEDLELERIKVTLDFCQKNPSAGVGAIRNVLKKGLPRNSNLMSLTAANRDELISQLYNQQEIISKQRLELLAANSERDLTEAIKEAQEAILSNFLYTHQSDSDSAELLKNINSDTTPRTLGQQVDEITQEITNVEKWQKEASAKNSSQKRTIARNMLKQRKCNWEGNTTGEKEGVLVPPAEFINNLKRRINLLESLRNKLLEIEQTPQKIAEKKQAELAEQARIQKEEAERKAKEDAERKAKEKAEQERSVQEVIEINKQAKKERMEQEKRERQEEAKRSQSKVKLETSNLQEFGFNEDDKEQNKSELETSEPKEIGSSGDFKDENEVSSSVNEVKDEEKEKINNLQTVEDCQKEIARINSDTTLIESTKESLKKLLNLRINYLTQLESIKGLQTSSECQKKIDEINEINKRTELNQNDRGSLIKSLVYKKARFEQEEQAKIAREKAEQDRLEKERLEQERLAKEEAERLAKEEAERLAKEEAERLAKEEAERLAKEETERLAKEEAERLAKEEAERLAKEEAERLAKEEAERLAKEKAERLAKEEAERLAREKAEQERLEKERLENERLEREKIKVQEYINKVISENYHLYENKQEKLSVLQKDLNDMDSRQINAKTDRKGDITTNTQRKEARQWFSKHQIQWGRNSAPETVNYLTVDQAKTAYSQAIDKLKREINEEQQQEKAEQERLEQERLAKEKAEYEAAVPFHANLTNVKKENGSLILEIANNTKTIEISNDIIGAIMKHNNISDFSPRSIDFHLENTDGFKVLRKDGYFGSLRCFNENEGQYSSISLPASDERNILIVTSDGYIRATDLDGKSLDEVTTTKTDIENIQQTYPTFKDNDGLKLDESLSKLNIKIDEINTLYKDQDENVHLVSGDNTNAKVTNIVEFLGGQLSVEPKSQPISSNEIISEETQATEDNNEITSNPGFFSRMSSKIKSFFFHGE